MVPFPLDLFLYLPFIMGLDPCHSSSLVQRSFSSTQWNDFNAILFRRDFSFLYSFYDKMWFEQNEKSVYAVLIVVDISLENTEEIYIQFIWYLIDFVWVGCYVYVCVYIMKNYCYSYSCFFISLLSLCSFVGIIEWMLLFLVVLSWLSFDAVIRYYCSKSRQNSLSFINAI